MRIVYEYYFVRKTGRDSRYDFVKRSSSERGKKEERKGKGKEEGEESDIVDRLVLLKLDLRLDLNERRLFNYFVPPLLPLFVFSAYLRK